MQHDRPPFLPGNLVSFDGHAAPGRGVREEMMETRYIRCQPWGWPAEWVAVQARPVRVAGAEGLDLFVHPALDQDESPIRDLYHVTDGLTGYHLADGMTPNAAIQDFQRRMARRGMAAFLELQARAFEAHGGEDWTGAERDVAELSVA